MNVQSDATIVLEVTNAVEELTRQHGEFLLCVQRLKDELHRSPTTASHQPPAPRFLQPPPPYLQRLPPPRPGMTPLPPPQPTAHLAAADDLGVPPSVPSRAQGSPGAPLPLTKRHYDYFAELDDLLGRLPAAPGSDEPKPPLGP